MNMKSHQEPSDASHEPVASQSHVAPRAVGHAPTETYPVVIVGGGTAGISVASRLARHLPGKVAIIEPSSEHFYQPAWTLVGAGTYDLNATIRSEASVIPKKTQWIQDSVVSFDPDRQCLQTRSGTLIGYEYLVVASGLRLAWEKVKGLPGNVGKRGICSNYSRETVMSTWEALQNFQGGTALFTHPSGPVKCGGAPQKICYLADDYFRRTGVRDSSQIMFACALDSIFAVPKYRETLERVVERKGIDTRFLLNLVEVNADEQIAIFEHVETHERSEIKYDLLHVTPPMTAPKFIADSPLSDESGFVDVDPHTLRHRQYPEVFALGDCSNLPTSKTGAAIRKQAPALVSNLLAARDQRPLTGRYDGYTSCPLVTGYGKLVLAEFDYGKQPAETFPFDQSKERRTMYWLKKYLLPKMYWWGMLKGRA